MTKRTYGTGHLYEKSGSYYGRWRTGDGRQLNRKVGPVRNVGETDGLTRAQAEREFRRLQDAEERSPKPVRGVALGPLIWRDASRCSASTSRLVSAGSR